MRKRLNRLLASSGYRIERLSRFDRQIAQLLQLQRPFAFAQIGANDGVRFDGLFHLVTRHACRGIVVEPLPDMFERLRLNYADYPSIIAINKAVHAHATSLPLYRLNPAARARYPGWTTGIASFDLEHLTRHSIAPSDIATEQVACLPLMALLESTQLLALDLLQVDAEGYDAAIVRMLDFARCKPGIIKFEHKHLSRNERSYLVRDLSTHGYRATSEGSDTVAWLDRPD